MNTLQIFSNAEFGEIRTIKEDGKVLFCGSDVAKALGYKRPNDAVSAHCRGTVKRRIADTIGREQEMNFVTEGDIYRKCYHLSDKTAVTFTGRKHSDFYISPAK